MTRNMKLKLAIKFPTPYEWWSNALPPREEKESNAQGMPGKGGGGMLKLRFDWYIIIKPIGVCKIFKKRLGKNSFLTSKHYM